jgi:polysaccharide export outer membrane protein
MKLNKVLFVVLATLLSSCITTRDLDIVRVTKETEISIKKESYRICSGDLLAVQINSTTPIGYDFFNKSSDNISQRSNNNPYLYGYLVSKEGEISLPILGDFTAKGKSIAQLEQDILVRAKDYFDAPHVKLNILNFDVTILGEVKNPGRINVLKPELNIIDALGLAGDMNEMANRKKIKVMRFRGDNQQIFYLDITDPDVVHSEAFYLQPEDIVSVVPMKKRFFTINSLPTAISTVVSAITLFYLINPAN